MTKISLTMNELFSGIGAQKRGIDLTGLFDCKVVSTSEIDKEAIVSYAAIHCGLTNDLIDTYDKYPTREEMVKLLSDRNIGYDFKKNKPYNWSKYIRQKNKTLEKYYLACVLSNNLGDISRIKTLPYADLWTYSFPCFTKDNYVLTDKGYKTIDKIEVGDKVLTHNNNYEKVVKVINNGVRDTIRVKGQCIDEIITTKNHKFYVRKKHRKWNNERRSYDRVFQEPEWLEIGKITKDYYLGIAINQNSIIPKWDGIDLEWSDGRKTRHKNDLQPLMENKNFWWLIGRYIADGWIKTQRGVVIAIGKHKLNEFIDNIGDIFNYHITEERTAYKCHISSKELEKFVLQFGKGAKNKRITNTIIDLSTDLLEAFLNGYLSGDGYYNKKERRYKCSSVSRELLIGLGQCVAKVYKTPFCLYKTKRPKYAKIEGRTVTQQDSYELTFKKDIRKQDNAFYENGYIWYPLQDIEDNGKEEVFDIEVENAHSFTVQNTIVHNCQDTSVAGKGAGIKKGTRSGLLYEVERLLEISIKNNTPPKFLLLENVKNLVGKKHKPDFDRWLNRLDVLGYNTYWQVINGKECGIPQNRERVFAISIRKDIDTGLFEFNKPFDNGLRLKDLLDETVDEKYYISEDKLDRFITELNNSNALMNDSCQVKRECKSREYNEYSPTLTSRDYKDPRLINETTLLPIDKSYNNPKPIEIANCITAREDRGISNRKKEGTAVLESKIIQLGNYREPSGKFDNPQTGRVYSPDGISPTLNTMQGGDRQPKILEDFYSNREIRQYEEYSPTLRSERSGLKVSDRRIRKLTPTECFRLMGFTDRDINLCMDMDVADSQLYKQAGNSIITTCIMLLMEHLYKAQYDNTYACTDEIILNGEMMNINFTQPQVV